MLFVNYLSEYPIYSISSKFLDFVVSKLDYLVSKIDLKGIKNITASTKEIIERIVGRKSPELVEEILGYLDANFNTEPFKFEIVGSNPNSAINIIINNILFVVSLWFIESYRFSTKLPEELKAVFEST